MARILLRNAQNETVADFSQPDAWRPAPDIIVTSEHFYRLYGRQDGVISYCQATVEELPQGIALKGGQTTEQTVKGM